MKLRNGSLSVPLLLLFGCSDLEVTTAPDAFGPTMDVSTQSVVHEVVYLLDDFNPGSLRHALAVAANGHVITFSPELAGDTIRLVHGELFIGRSLAIVGPPGGIAISGNEASRVFRVQGAFEVVLDNLTIRDGRADLSGGGLTNNGGNVIIRNSTVERNWAPLNGAGINTSGGSVTLVNSTVSWNGAVPALPATVSGGGIFNFRGSVHVINSTISSNTVQNSGGGIAISEGALTVTHGTIANNGANTGGGIAIGANESFPAVVQLNNTIVARNLAAFAAGGPDIGDLASEFVTLNANHSLVGTATGHTLTPGDDLFIGVDPLFEVDGIGKPLLADNGGNTLTHALREGSPAIGAAEVAVCAGAPVNGLDQRGVTRPQGLGCDMGAVESEFGATAPLVVSAISINGSPSVDKTTGAAYITGFVQCDSGGVVNLSVELSQEQKQKRLSVIVEGSAAVSVQCDGRTAWAAAVTGSNGVFVNGAADALARTTNVVPQVEAGESVRLFWSR